MERAPLEGDYKQFHIITAPPPSAGGVGLLQMLGILDGTNYESDGPNSTKAVHYEAEAMRRFYADRSEYLGDPQFYNVPVKSLLAAEYLAWRRRTIDPNHPTPSETSDLDYKGRKPHTSRGSRAVRQHITTWLMPRGTPWQ